MRQLLHRIISGLKTVLNKYYHEYIEALKELDVASAYMSDINKKILEYDELDKVYDLTPADILVFQRVRRAEERLKQAKAKISESNV